MTVHLDGPSQIPTQPRYAVVLLHGFGSDGQDLMALAPMLDALFPEELQGHVAYLAPDGTDVTSMGFGRQWFSDAGWTFLDYPGMQRSCRALEDYLLWRVLKPYQLDMQRVLLFGFSQGGMQALFCAGRWQTPPVACVCHSGKGLWLEELADKPHHKVPTLLLHGEQDEVVPLDAMQQTRQQLGELGWPVQSKAFTGLGHGIDGASLQVAAEFIQQQLTKA